MPLKMGFCPRAWTPTISASPPTIQNMMKPRKVSSELSRSAAGAGSETSRATGASSLISFSATRVETLSAICRTSFQQPDTGLGASKMVVQVSQYPTLPPRPPDRKPKAPRLCSVRGLASRRVLPVLPEVRSQGNRGEIARSSAVKGPGTVPAIVSRRLIRASGPLGASGARRQETAPGGLMFRAERLERRQRVSVVKLCRELIQSPLQFPPVLEFSVPFPQRRAQAIRSVLLEPRLPVLLTQFADLVHQVLDAAVVLSVDFSEEQELQVGSLRMGTQFPPESGHFCGKDVFHRRIIQHLRLHEETRKRGAVSGRQRGAFEPLDRVFCQEASLPQIVPVCFRGPEVRGPERISPKGVHGIPTDGVLQARLRFRQIPKSRSDFCGDRRRIDEASVFGKKLGASYGSTLPAGRRPVSDSGEGRPHQHLRVIRPNGVDMAGDSVVTACG